jgi:hypothetical protein
MKDSFYIEPELVAALSKQKQYLREAEEYNRLHHIQEFRSQIQRKEAASDNQAYCCSDRVTQT